LIGHLPIDRYREGAQTCCIVTNVTIHICLVPRKPPGGQSSLRLRPGVNRVRLRSSSMSSWQRPKPKAWFRTRCAQRFMAASDKVGWYIRKNESIAIGEDGGYYVLTVPGGLRERFTGVKLTPSAPPLVIGRGGKDGESGDIADFLRWRLEAG
jgi:hypothetical protein